MEKINSSAFDKFKGNEITKLNNINGGSKSYEQVGCGSSSSVDSNAYERSDVSILGIKIWGGWHPM
jgi:hypothetical protein